MRNRGDIQDYWIFRENMRLPRDPNIRHALMACHGLSTDDFCAVIGLSEPSYY